MKFPSCVVDRSQLDSKTIIRSFYVLLIKVTYYQYIKMQSSNALCELQVGFHALPPHVSTFFWLLPYWQNPTTTVLHHLMKCFCLSLHHFSYTMSSVISWCKSADYSLMLSEKNLFFNRRIICSIFLAQLFYSELQLPKKSFDTSRLNVNF